MSRELDTEQIRTWRSIVTLIVFVLTNVVVLFPFRIPLYIPLSMWDAASNALRVTRVISQRAHRHSGDDRNGNVTRIGRWQFRRLDFPLNFVTAPLIADLFLLAILAIGRQEVHDGTIGADGISPLDVMVFFLSLAYIAISIDASGLIRYWAFKVVKWGGSAGHRLFFYLYAFFFALATFVGNDPVMLSGTAFLAYQYRVSENIKNPKAWIYTQFAVANIASAILVSSNPTNLVLAGAFNIQFIHYTANMIVPVVVTAIVLFPVLLYVIFRRRDESLIPPSIKMHELPDWAGTGAPVNPNIPNAGGDREEQELVLPNGDRVRLLSLEEILNPFLDKKGAACGAIVMAMALITVLALNAASASIGSIPVFWITLPAAVLMFCFDIVSGWSSRHETRRIAREGREGLMRARVEQAVRKEKQKKNSALRQDFRHDAIPTHSPESQQSCPSVAENCENTGVGANDDIAPRTCDCPEREALDSASNGEVSVEKWNIEVDARLAHEMALHREQGPATLVSLVRAAYWWSQETFPTATAVLSHLPFALVPFALSMFVLVQALVTKGWVLVFAYGWDHWVDKTGTVGSVGGMGFLSVILCNFAGTNIGTAILLSRVIQAWMKIHDISGIPIADRTFWATVYSMALGLNYGAFSAGFSASLAGLLWRDILGRKGITVKSMDFARENLPIIAIAMTVGCVVLVGEVYIFRDSAPAVVN